MYRKLRGLVCLLLVISGVSLYPAPVLADSNPQPAGVAELQHLIQRIINLSVGLAFLALLFVLVSGGIRYIISAGDPKQTAAARSAITWGVVGILFLALAWIVLRLIGAFTGVNSIFTFCIGFEPYCVL